MSRGQTPPHPRPEPFMRAAKVLKITQCRDPLVWYSDMVGKTVPDLGDDGARFFKSREPSGLVNFVHRDDAQPVVAFVKSHQIGLWPYLMVLQDSSNSRPTEVSQATAGKSCAASCNRMGICQALDDCQDQRRLDAQLGNAQQPQTSPGQTRRHSALEAAANILIGFIVSLILTALVLPAYGHPVTLSQNVQITLIFTMASLLRSYGLRRLFNHLTHAQP